MIRWEPYGRFKQSKEMKEQCHVIDPDIDEARDDIDYLYAPAQLLGFVSLGDGVEHAIVRCCKFNFKKGSVFSTLWKQEYVDHGHGKMPRICHVNVKSIVGHVLMVPSDTDEGTYHQIWDKQFWADEFCVY